MKRIFAVSLVMFALLTGKANAAGKFVHGAHASVNLAIAGAHPAFQNVGECTVAVWINPSALVTSKILSFSNAAGNKERLVLTLIGSTGQVATGAATKDNDSSTQGAATPASSIAAGSWYQIAASWVFGTGGTGVAKVYVNGVLVTAQSGLSFSAATTANTASAKARLGSAYGAGSLFFEGDLEDIQLYQRALTDAEVAGLYATPGSNVVDLVNEYPFNDLSSYTFTSNSVHDIVGSFPGRPSVTIFNETGPVP